jgi:Uncharacterized conserved protein
MDSPPRWLVVGLVLALAASGVLVATLGSSGPYDRTTLTITDEQNATALAAVEARVADTFKKRYTGLSNTTSLGANEGMLFVHDRNAPGYVMRDMAFPIDIVFIDSDGKITRIHHAAVDADRTFHGPGRYVLELPYNYTRDNDITVGDRVEIPTEYR